MKHLYHAWEKFGTRIGQALYSATKKFKKDGETAPALRYIADKITNDPRKPKKSRASQLADAADGGAAQSSEAPTSKASSTTGVVETDFSYAFLWRPQNPFRVLNREHSYYRAITGDEVPLPWEKFGTRIGLFVCGPFFARLLVTDDKGSIALECKPCANVGQEYSSPGSFFEVFDYKSLPHTLLVPYSTNPQLAEQLFVGDPMPLPLLNLEGLRKFEDLSTQVYTSALEMRVAAALGKRHDPSPTSTSAQGQDSGFPTLCGGGGQGGEEAMGAKSGGPQAKEEEFQENFEDDVEENVEEDDEQDFLDKVKSWTPNSADPAFASDPAPRLPPTSRPPSTSGSSTSNDSDEESWAEYVDTDSLPPSITIKAVLSSTMDQLIDDALRDQDLLSGCTAGTSERPSPTRTARTDGSGSTPGTARPPKTR
ncbi:hypothetical protein B9479_006078 [Cryptococcus floricola]|uniref:Uncharacterized protein n=1 Tax=Cryptococcus floricola TaxID=2591691 RepID=A0A5D3ARG8_9TREE|nr:hypothetical protein B9479_006078 [Cryptococcus floricola]